MPWGGCYEDQDCTDPNWCNIAQAQCTAQVPNGGALPADANHVTPVLDGNCQTAAANLVCVSGVCDADNACGYANGDGSCAASNASTVCRSGICGTQGTCGLNNGDAGCSPATAGLCQSGACSVNGTCMLAGGCNDDGDCIGGWCQIDASTCMGLVQNGNAMPVDGGHVTPTLDGNCSDAGATLVCASGVCDSRDHACGFANSGGNCLAGNANVVCRAQVCGADQVCGFANNEGACTPSDANGVCRAQVCGSDALCGLKDGDPGCTSGTSTALCRSGLCSTNGDCLSPNACYTDGDCAANTWCAIALSTCMPQIVNGQPMPSDANHLSPVLDGNCSVNAAILTCVAGVCDTADQRCGFANGDGDCSQSDPNVVCRGSICGSDGACGLSSHEGPCNNANALAVCRSGTCSADGTCMLSGGCNDDQDCTGGWCNVHLSACQLLVPNGGVLPSDANHLSPVLDGNCSPAAATVVCESGVCNGDGRCGLTNGTGPCAQGNAITVCRSQVCGGDEACGHPSGEGPCSQGNATLVCRDGACSVHGAVCEPTGGCAVDTDCGADQFCNTAAFACASKLSNGTAIPSIGGHAPGLDGNCNNATAAAVCYSHVCDTDNACGYANGDGPCNPNAPGVCRSGTCATAGTCIAPATCLADNDCDTATQYCNTDAALCASKIANGGALVRVTGHAPALDGNCTPSVAAVMCQSGVCDSDKACGYGKLGGPCNATTAGRVCRSSTCSPNGGVCIISGGCGVDTDCLAGLQWCDTSVLACTPLLDNRTSLPTAPGHDPVLDGHCRDGVGSSVCASGVCDTDNACGLADGHGVCASSDSVMKCRSGDCSVAGVCMSAGSCWVDGDCLVLTQYCDNDAGVCAAKRDNGAPLPVVTTHMPGLNGTCSDTAAAIACTSGVCSIADQDCGYALGEGTCSAQDGNRVCRSKICASAGSAAHTCVTCATDAQCTGALPACDPSGFNCVQCTEVNPGACAGATPVCDTQSSTCVPCSADYGASAATACPSSTAPSCVTQGPARGGCTRCATDQDCEGHAAGTHCDVSTGACGAVCATDSDCAATSFCSSSALCLPKVDNGQPLPSEATGCTDSSGTRYCVSGRCDASDGLCGQVNGSGPCTLATECRAAACSTVDGLCGLPLLSGTCTADDQCRSGLCGTGQVCVTRCAGDADCDTGQYCAAGTCSAALDDGAACTRDAQCSNEVCASNVCGVAAWVPVGNGLGGGCAAADSSVFGLGVALGAWWASRRRCL